MVRIDSSSSTSPQPNGCLSSPQSGPPIAQMCRYAELAREDEHTADERRKLLQQHATRVEEQMLLLSRQYEHLREKIRFYERLPGPVPEAEQPTATRVGPTVSR